MWTRRVFLAAVVLLSGLGGSAIAGLIGHWAFDEGAGTVAKDGSGGGHDGQLVDGPQWADGLMGGALEFDGVKARVDIPYWSGVTPGNGMTMAAWVFPKDTSRACIIGQFEGYGMALMTGLQLKSVIWGADWVLSDVTIPENEWSHITMTWNVEGSERVIFLDGQPVGRRPDSSVPSVQNPLGIGLWIGWPDAWGDDSFTGLIDDVRLYDLVLTEGQVAGLFNGASPTFTKAFEPSPADGAVGVNMPLFQWSAGETATFHSLYLGTTSDLTEADLKAPRQAFPMYYHPQGLAPGATYFWRVDEIEADGVTVHVGDVWSFVVQDVTAYYPTPRDGANTASLAAALTWMPGVGATRHHVYFGDSREAVNQGATEVDKGTLAETVFALETLEPLTTYFWRVDETVVGDEIKAGPVWSFTTVLPVDDFETYTDDEGGRVYETWIDGWTNGTGSVVGYLQAPFAEQTIVHGGRQSMPLDYNNVVSPFHSEAERELTPTQDWTAGGIDTLILYVRGRIGNDPAPLYVTIEDSTGRAATAVHPDSGVVTKAAWTEWQLPLSDFGDVNLARIEKLIIGVGDKADPKAGGTGRIYVDDICLTRPHLSE